MHAILLALSLGATVPAQDEIVTAETIAIPVPGAFDEIPRRSARRGSTTYVNGTSFAPGSIERFPFVVALEPDGSELWRWTGETIDAQVAGLFAPSAGDGVFTLEFDLQDQIRARRLDGGLSSWTAILPEAPGGGSLFAPDLELTGAADGSRLFGLIGRESIFDFVVSLDPLDGSPLWSTALPTDIDPVAIACSDDGSRIAVLGESIVGTSGDRLFVLDGANGDLLTTVNLALVFVSGVPRHLTIDPAGQRAFVGGRTVGGSGVDLAAYALPSGALEWDTTVDGSVAALGFDANEPGVIVASTPDTFELGQPVRLSSVRPAVGQVQWTRVLDVAGFATGEFGLTIDLVTGRGALAYPTTTTVPAPAGGALELFELSSGASLLSVEEQLEVGANATLAGEFQTVAGQAAFLRVRSGAGSQDTASLEVAALRVADAAPLWTYAADFDLGTPRVEALWSRTAGDVAFATVLDGAANRRIARLDLTNGTLEWEVRLPQPCYVFPNPAVGRALAVTEDLSVVVTPRTFSSSIAEPELQALDGASGDVLWSVTLDLVGDAVDLEIVESGVSAPLVLSLHEQNILGRTTVRATELDGGLAWEQTWPTTGVGTWRVGALAAAPDEGQVHSLVSQSFPLDQLRVQSRSLIDGSLIGDIVLTETEFSPDEQLGVPIAVDLERDAGSGALFALGRYLGTVSVDPHLACARVDPTTGSVRWGVALDPSPLATYERCELVHGAGVVAIAAGAASSGDQAAVELIGLDDDTGDVLWTRTLGSAGAPRSLLDAAPSASGDALLVSTATGGASELFALDLATGTELWSTIVDGETDADRVERLASVDRGVLALLGSELAVPSGAARLSRLEPAALVGGPHEVSLADPAPIVLQLDRATSSSGAVYLVLGSLSGTTPTTPVSGVELPLAADAYTVLMASLPNTEAFESTLGVLSSTGDGRAVVQLPARLPGSVAGLELMHAFLEFGPLGATFASNPIGASTMP